ncbi:MULTISPECIES: hypothetical protein [Myroides]|uniref:Uncharacterized protein n=1 Tax=Myroides albus TaxID=2562892 RepID=A0A6I3LEY9_9FLAO|nr:MULTISPECIES: hypothetical protein [Myroides]MTG96773.1 hypothetical protein [Myroides albus]MVX36179.1 hypothetical protein [Myroides sp. LoEW2-1]UVD80815.1 hypothetical protein NWE55_06120 [Myroides albus]
MQRRINIARVLLIVAVLFTTVFQFIHSYEHVTSFISYANEHSTHAHFNEKREDSGNRLEYKVNHNELEKCFACDIIIPADTTPILELAFSSFEHHEKVQQEVVQTFIPLSHVYYSLRAPPVFV